MCRHLVGVARAISVALADGQVLDTIVYALATPLDHVPRLAAGVLMVPVHALLHVPVPSVSGHAVLTMPIMAPLADLLGLSRDAAVIAYQTGAGLAELLTPTNGAVLATVFGAGVPFGRWLRFAVPGVLLVSLVGLVGIALAGGGACRPRRRGLRWLWRAVRIGWNARALAVAAAAKLTRRPMTCRLRRPGLRHEFYVRIPLNACRAPPSLWAIT
jgi:hypothetical protein